jgi:Protein of unknown function (DUF3551)
LSVVDDSFGARNGESMQQTSRTLIALAALVTAFAAPAAATELPYCINGSDFGAGDCSFSTLAQCQASASGRDASCGSNPYFSARPELSKAEISKPEQPANIHHRSRRKF